MKQSTAIKKTMLPLGIYTVIAAAELLGFVALGPQSAVFVLSAGLLLSVAFSVYFYRRMNRRVFIPIKALSGIAQQAAKGKTLALPESVKSAEFGILSQALRDIMDSMDALDAETDRFLTAARDGRLEYRADESSFYGGHQNAVKNVNAMLDAVLVPLNETKEIFGRFFLNDYTQKMSENYSGYMKEFSESLNKIHYRFVNIQENFFKLTVGDTGRLEEFIQMKRKSENDQLLPAITRTLQTVRDLINETGRLAEAAVNGDLSVRGDADKFEGAYKDIIRGMNKTMEAIISPIVESRDVLEKVAAGDLAVEMTGEYRGEYNQIKESINNTIRSFNGILNDINSASHQVSAGAGQVSDSSMMLSQGATQQASSVQQLTASIEQISNQTEQNAKDANQANQLAETARDNAEKGNNKMKEMLRSMEGINVSSNNISKIIKVIDDIAFQTNILALNAAVEAARAGQHGKGFTVVAEEVRTLAARSADAANETTEMIKDSLRIVEEGTLIANETAAALNEIVEGVAKAAHLVNNIAAASNEQSAAIAQVNQGIQQVSQVVQKASSMSEESASASEELANQAELLKEHIAKFRLREDPVAQSAQDMSSDTVKRLEKLFDKGHVMADTPPKYAQGEKRAVSINKY